MKSTDMQPNHRIKRFVFDYYAVASVLILICAITLLLSGILNWKTFAVIIGSIATFALGVQKQNLDETQLFKKLFEQFNERYDKLNDKLNHIYFDEQPADKPFTDDERKTLYQYFNLCGEEWLYAKKGFIWREAWTAWENGMKFFQKNPRIKDFWNKDLSDNDSYYGLKL
jgi:hypothetical protein